MRQIQLGACLAVIFAAVAACSGESFSAGDGSGNGSPAYATGGSANNRGSSGNGSPNIASDSGGEEADQGTLPSSSGGTAASGGNSASGGGSMSGGTGNGNAGGASAGGTPAPSGGECASGSVRFKMVPAVELPHDYLCDAGCGSGWLTITDAAGATAFSLFSACGVASCETCELQACVASACLPKPLTGEGVELTWNGSFFTKDTCGEAMACQKPACVKPGKYKAKACAAINAGNASSGGSCTPKDSTLCAEAEFEFPSSDAVKLVLTK